MRTTLIVILSLTISHNCWAENRPALLTPSDVWKDFDPDQGDFKEEIISAETRNGIFYRESYISAYVLGEEIRVYCKYSVKEGATNVPGLMNVHGWMSSPTIDQSFVDDGWAVMSHDYCGKVSKDDRPHYTKYPEKLRYGNMDANVGVRIKSKLPDGSEITDPKQTDDYLWYAIQRRVLSYLLAQKEVDATRIGAKGYSYGGTIMWNLGMDPRVKAIVAYFGIGWLEHYRNKQVWMYNNPYQEPEKSPGEKIYLSAIAPQAHAPYITAASLWLNGTNDHHGGHERAEQTFKMFQPGVPWSFAHQPRGHHDTDDIGQNCKLWLEKHVLGKNVTWPERPESEITLDVQGVPELQVTPALPENVAELTMYYALKEPVSFVRAWRDTPAVRRENTWVGKLPVLNVDDYVFGFANIKYDSTIVLSTDFNAAIPSQLGKAVATDKPSNVLSEGTGAWLHVGPVVGKGGIKGFRAISNRGTFNEQFGDPKWKAPNNGQLSFKFYCTQPQTLTMVVNGDYQRELEIPASDDWQSTIIPASSFTNSHDQQPMGDWGNIRKIEIKPKPGMDITKVIFSQFKWVVETPKIKADDEGRVYLTKGMASKNDSFWRVMIDQAVGGNSISVGGKTYKKGLGVHADSEMTFPLQGRFATFHVVPGPDDAHHGLLEMKILVDDEEVFAGGKTRSIDKQPRKPVDISVKGAKTLTLIVDSLGDRGGDHASWADAYLTVAECGDGRTRSCRPATSELALPLGANRGFSEDWVRFSEDGSQIVVDAEDITEFKGVSSAVYSQDGKNHRVSTRGFVMIAPVRRSGSDTPFGEAVVSTATYSAPGSPYQYTLTLKRLKNLRAFTLQAVFHNRSNQDVRLQGFDLLDLRRGSGGKLTVKDSKDWLVTPLMEDSPAVSLHEANQRVKEVAVFRHEGGKGFLIGPIGPAEAYTHLDVREQVINAVAEMDNVLVRAGESRRSEEMIVSFESTTTSTDIWTRWVAITHGARLHRGPVYGWCSWYDRTTKIDAAHVLEVVETIQRHPNTFGKGIIQIDDGYQKMDGDWSGNGKFPEGMAAVAQRIRAAGCTPGVWFAPLMINPEHPWVKANPDAIQTNAKGIASFMNANPFHPAGANWINPDHPKSKEFLSGIIRDARQRGNGYIKIDFNGIGGRFVNPTKTRLQVFRELYQLYRKAAGEEMYILSCLGQPTRGVIGFIDSARVGPDSHPAHFEKCLQSVLRFQIYDNVWWQNDPDVTYLAPKLESRRVGYTPQGEGMWRTWHNVVGLVGGTAMISEPVNMPDVKAVWRNFEVIRPSSRETARMLNLGQSREDTIFGFAAKRPYGNFAVYNLYNSTEGTKPLTLDFKRAGLLPGVKHAVFDFWDNRVVGFAADSYTTAPLEHLSSSLVRLTPLNSELPVLVGSNLHISMGATEINDVRVSPSKVELELSDAGAQEGSLTFYSRQSLLAADSENCKLSSVENLGENLWRVNIAGRQWGKPQLIRLQVKVVNDAARQ